MIRIPTQIMGNKLNSHLICDKLNANHQTLPSDVTDYIRELFLKLKQFFYEVCSHDLTVLLYTVFINSLREEKVGCLVKSLVKEKLQQRNTKKKFTSINISGKSD